MPTLLNAHSAWDGAGAAVVDEAGTTTWAELGARVNRWIDVLTQSDAGPGDRIAGVIGNRREAFELLLAGLHAGIVVVPVNWHLTEPEIAHILRDAGCRGLVADPRFATVAAAAGRVLGPGAIRLVLGAQDRDGLRAVEPLLAAADPGEPAAQVCGSTMLYTSGTTGSPKGVQNGLFELGAPFTRVEKMCRYARVALGVQERGRFLLDGPWYHSSQLFFAVLPLLLGSTLVIRPRFDPVETLAAIDRAGITATHLVPTQLVRLLRVDPAARAAFSGSTLETVWHGGGPCPRDIKHRMIDWWGPVLLEYYGATEGGAVTLIDSHEWLRRPGSVGRAVPPNRILVVDDDGAETARGTTGRVFVERPTRRTFSYHNAPDKTRAAHLRDGVFTFGETGYLDEDGYLFLTGRAQDLIVSGGVNVYPAEVEAALLGHPAVRDAVVVGEADHEYGERVAAIVEVDPAAAGPADLAADLDRHCRRLLAGFKVPRRYVLSRLPREASGKVRRGELDRLLARHTEETHR